VTRSAVRSRFARPQVTFLRGGLGSLDCASSIDVTRDGRNPAYVSAVLLLSVIAIDEAPPPASIEAIFDELGGTIGRASGSTLILPDPRRCVSRLQARVAFSQEQWFITNVGSSELRVNELEVPPGTSARLLIGDVIRIHGFVIQVQAAGSRIDHGERAGPSPPDDPPLAVPAGTVRDGDGLCQPSVSGESAPGPSAANPFAELLSGSRQGQTSDVTQRAAAPSRPPDDFDPFAPPASPTFSLAPEPETPPPSPAVSPAPHLEASAEVGTSGAPAGGGVEVSDAFPEFRGSSNAALTSAAGPLRPAGNDDVSLGAAAPASCERGQWFVAHFAAYPPADEAKVSRLLEQQSPGARQILGKRTCRWAADTEVTVNLVAEGFEAATASQRFIWNGRTQTLDFRLRATGAAAAQSVVEFTVSIAGFSVARLCLNLQVGQRDDGESVQAFTAPARTAFASYASAERALVTHMVGAIEQSAGLDVFLDCLDLRASEDWKPRLEYEIAHRDRFLLFWSRRARSSRWVRWELEQALRHKDVSALQLHPLEPGVLPPEPLGHLHIGSVHTLVAAYYSKRPWWHRIWHAMLSR